MKYNIILFAQGRLASEIIKMMLKNNFFDLFELKLLVTNKLFFNDFKTIYTNEAPSHIDNKNRNEEQIINFIKSNKIDFIISIQHPWIISKKIIKMVSNKAFNLHNAKLPEYKGYNSISHAIINEEKYYYSTIHRMIEVVDEGNIICEKKFPINKKDDALSLYLKSIQNAVFLFKSFIEEKLFEKSAEKILSRSGTFYKKESIKNLCDLSKVNDKKKFDNYVRALFFPPHNVAYVMDGQKKIYKLPKSRKDFNLENAIAENLHSF